MTMRKLTRSLAALQDMLCRLQYELTTTNSEFIALTLELEERMDQLRSVNQQLAREIAERQRAERALQGSELRFRALVEKSSDIILLVNRDAICTYVSPSAERYLGYRPADIEGASIFTRVHYTERDRMRQGFLACLANPEAEIPIFLRVRASTGAWRYLEGVSCNRLHDPAVQAIVVNVRDVTERQHAEARIRQINRTLERKVRVRTAQLEVAYNFEATLKRITDKVRDSLDEDYILQTAVEELAQAIGVTCCNAAVYDLDLKTSAIRYEYSRNREGLRGRVIPMNNFESGYAQLLNGEHFQHCPLSANPEEERAAMLSCPIQDDEGVMGDLWLMHHSEYFFNEQDIRLVQQVANQCAIALRQSHLYQSARAQVVELERLNQLKDDFLSTVSHELRAPMTNIKLSSQMLAVQLQSLQLPQNTSVDRYIQILQDECEREISLINDLLDLARLDNAAEVLELKRICLEEHLPNLATPFLERMQAQNQQFILDIPPNLPAFASHEDYFDRIVTELLHNACKYTPPNESITVAVEVEPDPQATAAALPAAARPPTKPMLKVCVTNTGTEIPAEECDRIFDKFYRIPNNDPWKYGGTGLGLALVKKLAERLGSVIKVESQQKRTSFSLLFPLSSENLSDS